LGLDSRESRLRAQGCPQRKAFARHSTLRLHWFTGAPTKESETAAEKPNPTAEYIGTANALQLATAYNGKIQWDADDHNAYFYFYRDQMREWIFFTDLHTFKDRYELVQKDGLQASVRGFW